MSRKIYEQFWQLTWVNEERDPEYLLSPAVPGWARDNLAFQLDESIMYFSIILRVTDQVAIWKIVGKVQLMGKEEKIQNDDVREVRMEVMRYDIN